MRSGAWALPLFALQGCATTLSTLQTADVTDVGQVQVIGGTGLYVPVGPVVRLLEEGIQQARKIEETQRSGEQYTLTEEEQERLLTAAIGLAVLPPSQSWEFSARSGVWKDRMDLGLRYSVNAIRLDAKYQFLRAGASGEQDRLKRREVSMAVGLGVSRYLFDNPLIDLLEYVQLANFSRWDVEVPLIVSVDLADIVKFYGGARYLFSTTSIDAGLVNYASEFTNVSGFDVRFPSTVHMHYVGLSAGIAAGYRWVHLMAELNGGWTFCDPVLFGRRRSLGGPTVYPAVGIGVKIP